MDTCSYLEAKRIAARCPELGFVNRAALQDAEQKGGLEVISGVGMVCFHHRQDRQTTIRDLAVEREHRNQGWGRLLFYRVLCSAIERQQTSIFVKCPIDLPSNKFYAKLGFCLEQVFPGKKKPLNGWRYTIKLPMLFYCGGGGASPYDAIAVSCGFHLGIRSKGKKKDKTIPHMVFIDNKWNPYDHQTHLGVVQRHKPMLATACDIEDLSRLPEIIAQATELSQYAGRILLIPKCEFRIPSGFWLGFSVPTGHGKTDVNPSFFGSFPTHLLGGSPSDQAYYYHSLKNPVSLDQNYSMKSAKYGEVVCQNFRQKNLFQGKGFNYRAMRQSLEWQSLYWATPSDWLKNRFEPWKNFKAEENEFSLW